MRDTSKPTRVQQLSDGALEIVDWPARKLQSVRRSRWLSGFGGLLLACSFFLPAVPGCNNTPIVPARGWLDSFDGSPPGLDDLAAGFMIYGAAYFFGLLVLIMGLRSRGYRRKTERSLGLSVSVLVGSVGAVLAGLLGWDVIQGATPPSTWAGWAFVLIVLGGLVYWLRTLRMGPAGLLCARWLAALCGTLWFGLWVVSGDALYGLWLSFIGCLCIVAGTSMEAAARSPEGGWSTLWDLLRCRYTLHDLEGNRCVQCDYLLIGLTSSRCPECGHPFEMRICP